MFSKEDVHSSSDADLVEAMAAGCEGALAELYRRYAGPMLAVVRRLIGEERLAEDVVQEVFIGAWDRPGRYDSRRGSVRTWLFVQARSRSLDVLRSERSRHVRERNHDRAVVNARDESPEEIVSLTDAVGEMLRAVSGLSDAQRQVIELAYFDGLTYRQIAAVLGLPEGTVKGRIRLGLDHLRAELSVR